MDDIVRAALAKWPNVPAVYGWLSLDRRGNWRLKDERIGNAALRGFIARNYESDTQGRWYFQNGPQRVYLNLEATPFIARTDPLEGLVLHTGEPLAAIQERQLDEEHDADDVAAGPSGGGTPDAAAGEG